MSIDTARKTIIFDFDGTLADTFEILVDTIDRYSGDFGVELDKGTFLEELRSLPVKEILKKFHIPLFMVPFILKKERKNMLKHAGEIFLFSEVLGQLKILKSNYNLGILTSNSTELVQQVLKREHALDLFDFIHSENTLFGKHKLLKKLIKKYKLSYEDVVYIGDEARDVEACNKAGVTVISVGWGFNSSELLKKVNAKNYVENAEEMSTKIRATLRRNP